MKAGKSDLDCNTKIVIKNIIGEDEFLNGRTGRITHPFGCFPEGDVGIYLDSKTDTTMGISNLFLGEFEDIEEK